ncbi:hypothetical protein BH11BAC1_BH11BAC1_09420 [soil metagenome]
MLSIFFTFSIMKNTKKKKPVQEDRIVSKDEAKHRIDKLDPNNNKNLPKNPMVKRRNKKIHDDGFEHRTSEETAFPK